VQHVPPERWPWAIALYALLPLAIALLIQPAQLVADRAGAHPAAAIVVGVNIVLPLSIVAVALWYPRRRTVLAAPVLALVGFTVGRALVRDARVWVWTPGFLLSVLHPIVVAACVASGVIALTAASVVRLWRRVGLADEHQRCGNCGYLCIGLPENRCPECGASFERSADSQ
jgi:hypothetical protein